MTPLIDKQTIATLRYVHGAYNFLVYMFACFQLYMGLKIRSARISGIRNPAVQKRHRQTGPYLAVLAAGGFIVGLTLIILDTGRVLDHPYHLTLGALIVAGLAHQWISSKSIRPADDATRRRHRWVGLSLAAVYSAQVLIGLGILF